MNKQINVSELDFDNIKNNLKNFLKGQSTLSDYDFEGSGLSILVDLLAYNTHYNSLYTNMALNESFLDTASKRESVVSLATMLGYLPRSAKCATATVDLIISNPTLTPASAILPKYSAFSCTANGKSYFFYNTEDIPVVPVNGIYRANAIEIKEGIPNYETYTVSDTTKYIISNKNVDVDTVKVIVKESSSSTAVTTYTLASDILNVKSTDTVFFLKEIYDNNFEVSFGNDKLGKALTNGNIVTIEYFITNRADANDIRQFALTRSIVELGGSSFVITVLPSSGGDEPETASEIRFNAPKLLNSHNRAVTANDYLSVIKANYTNIDTINVWGGEDNIPPVYGKVFMCIKPKYSSKLSVSEKELIKIDLLKNRNVIGVTPEFVDPNYINLQVNIVAHYDKAATTRTKNDLISAIDVVVRDYNETSLKKFDSVFRYSKFLKLIDGVDSAILSNITNILIRRPVNIYFNTKTPYTIDLHNPIYAAGVPEEAVTTTGFYVTGDASTIFYMEDDGLGNLIKYTLDTEYNKIYSVGTFGTVNYEEGTINLTEVSISRLANTKFEFFIKPASNDIISRQHNIVQLDTNNIIIDAVVDSTAFGGSSYVFTKSR
jgi:hypothetical protein